MLLAYLEQRPQHGFIADTVSNFVNDTGMTGMAAVGEERLPEETVARESGEKAKLALSGGSALVARSAPLGIVLPSRDGIVAYKVQKGDTLPKVAASFGVSPATIAGANPAVKNGILRRGQELLILPVNGALHRIQEGERIEDIAAEYGVDAGKIVEFNHSLANSFEAGSLLVIPGATQMVPAAKLPSAASLPSLPGYFAIPTTGWNWGRLHNYNAVDIANACGTPVYAAAEGLVIEESAAGWNGGYGSYIVIEHSNGTKTKYAHNQDNLVSAGDYVAKGDQIATIGNTGNTHGPTGCHLHFEVHGAKNPFAK